MQIGVWTRKIWSCKVGDLKVSLSNRGHAVAPIPRNCMPKRQKWQPNHAIVWLPRYCMRDPRNCTNPVRNCVPESNQEHPQATQLRQIYAIAWTPIRSPNFVHFGAQFEGEMMRGIKGGSSLKLGSAFQGEEDEKRLLEWKA